MTKLITGDLLAVGQEPKGDHSGPAMTRRQLLAGTGKVALFAVMPFGCTPQSNTPFADGTFWHDGSGWTT